MRDAEPLGKGRAVAIVAVDELQDAGGGAGATDTVLQPVLLQRVDQPDAALCDERVRAAL